MERLATAEDYSGVDALQAALEVAAYSLISSRGPPHP
jgi:hypothetical protein